MTTQTQLNNAKEAYSKEKQKLDACIIDRDAYQRYVDQINQGIWDPANGPIPSEGPLTKLQAAQIGVEIPGDNAMPLVFSKSEIWQLAGNQLNSLGEECLKLEESTTAAKDTYDRMTAQWNADMERARQIADQDPVVIAAKENAAAAEIKAKSDQEKRETEAESSRKQMRMMVFGLIGIAAVAVVIVVVAKVIK